MERSWHEPIGMVQSEEGQVEVMEVIWMLSDGKVQTWIVPEDDDRGSFWYWGA